MRVVLEKELFKLTDLEYRELQLRFQVADILRLFEGKHYMREPSEIAELLGYTARKYKKARNGAVDFSLKEIATIHAFKNKLDFEEVAKQNKGLILGVEET